MPRPLPKVPYVESPFVQRRELLTVVPLSMATIDRLEGRGQFPKRVRLEPTNRVAWFRREVTTFLRQFAKRTVTNQAPSQPGLSSATRIGFDTIPGQLFCKCGVDLSRFHLRRHSDNSASISCCACHAELAQINFSLERRS
jgi:prophage regulatory protein